MSVEAKISRLEELATERTLPRASSLVEEFDQLCLELVDDDRCKPFSNRIMNAIQRMGGR